MSKRVQSAAQVLSRADMIAELRALKGGRSMRKCGLEWGVDFHEISAVLKERQYPGAKLLEILGLREESMVMYVRVTGGGQ